MKLLGKGFSNVPGKHNESRPDLDFDLRNAGMPVVAIVGMPSKRTLREQSQESQPDKASERAVRDAGQIIVPPFCPARKRGRGQRGRLPVGIGSRPNAMAHR